MKLINGTRRPKSALSCSQEIINMLLQGEDMKTHAVLQIFLILLSHYLKKNKIQPSKFKNLIAFID